MAGVGNTGLFYHEVLPSTVRIAQTVGITASAFLCGATFAASFTQVPALMKAPAPLLAQQFKKTLENEATTVVPLTVISGVAFGWLAYREHASVSASRLYAAAAVLVPATLPYIATIMLPTINKIVQKADSMAGTSLTDSTAEAGVAKDETTHALVDKWATMNLGKVVLYGIGAICGAWAIVDRVDVVGVEKIGLTTGANRLG